MGKFRCWITPHSVKSTRMTHKAHSDLLQVSCAIKLFEYNDSLVFQFKLCPHKSWELVWVWQSLFPGYFLVVWISEWFSTSLSFVDCFKEREISSLVLLSSCDWLRRKLTQDRLAGEKILIPAYKWSYRNRTSGSSCRGAVVNESD